MTTSFWKALEALGATGSARRNWHHCLGDDWTSCMPLLEPTGRDATTVIDPRHPQRRLELMADGAEDFVAIDDDPSVPPVPMKADEVSELRPRWSTVASHLAKTLGFDCGAWEATGDLRRIGSSQDAFGRVTPVLLFLPAGHFGDYPGLMRALSDRTESTVLLPTHRWLTADLEALRARNRLEFVDLSGRFRLIESQPTTQPALPVIVVPPKSSSSKQRAVIHCGNGLTWSQVTVRVGATRTIYLSALGQTGIYTFPKRANLSPEHPLGILMRLVKYGYWNNPDSASPDYERVSKAFWRCKQLLKALVPLPGDPFQKSSDGLVPRFRVVMEMQSG